MKKAHEHSHYRSSRVTGIPCAMVLTGSCVLAPVRPAFVSPSPAESPSADLAPAARAPGPHAFAVRVHAARLATYPRPSHSIPRSWRSRPAPRLGWNGRTMHLIWGPRQANFFKSEHSVSAKPRLALKVLAKS